MKKNEASGRLMPINGVGFVYDLYFPFILHYNREKGFADAVNYKKSISDTEYFSRLVEECGCFSAALSPFFSQREGSKCFMLTCFFGISVCDENAPLTSLCDSLSDTDKVFRYMLEYYFPKKDIGALKRSDIAEIALMIRESSLDDSVKSGLYSFFIDPEASVALLCEELRAKSEVIVRRREELEASLDALADDFDFDEFLQRAVRVKDISLLPEKLYITFCAAAKNAFEIISECDGVCIMLGTDWRAALEAKEQKKRPELDSFGNVISEKHRIEILELMMRNGTVTIRDLEQELGLTGTNAYYHLNLMIKVGMVSTRNVGRTVFYSLDRDYFASIIKMIKNFVE